MLDELFWAAQVAFAGVLLAGVTLALEKLVDHGPELIDALVRRLRAWDARRTLNRLNPVRCKHL